MGIQEVGDHNFEAEVLKAPGVVVVDFWAPWCAPCRVQHPILEELAGEMTNVTFTSINVDEHPNVGGRFQIMSIPTLMVFKGGAPVAQFIGLQNKEVLRSKFANL